MVNRLSTSGFVLTQEYAQLRDGEVSFGGHGVFWVDPKTGEQCLHWWDSMGIAPNVFRGGWEGDTLVLESAGPGGHVRGTWVMGDRSFTHRMEMSPDGETWRVFMDGVYRPA